MRAGPGEPGPPWRCGPPPVTASMIVAVTDDLPAASPAGLLSVTTGPGATAMRTS